MAKTRATKLTARSADKFLLYEQSVQWPEFAIGLFTRVFRSRFGRAPLRLREDFCGTALLCATWVRGSGERAATGIDLDGRVLEWGRKHNVEPLGDAAGRVRLLRSDVAEAPPDEHDVAVALNYSYCVFKERRQLVRYFENVRHALGTEGLFLLDCFGGQKGVDVMVEKRSYGGFSYEWEQVSFNPIDHHLLSHIHFQFPDRTRLERAFTYDWRHWSIPELRDALADAGFPRVDVLWEGATADGKGDGKFIRRTRAVNDPKWNAYLAAFTR